MPGGLPSCPSRPRPGPPARPPGRRGPLGRRPRADRGRDPLEGGAREAHVGRAGAREALGGGGSGKKAGRQACEESACGGGGGGRVWGGQGGGGGRGGGGGVRTGRGRC